MSDIENKDDFGAFLDGVTQTSKSKVDDTTFVEKKTRELAEKAKAKAKEVKEQSKPLREKALKESGSIIDHTGELSGKGVVIASEVFGKVGVFKQKTGLSLVPIVLGVLVGGFAVFHALTAVRPSVGVLNRGVMQAQNINNQIQDNRLTFENVFQTDGLPELDMKSVAKDVHDIRYTTCRHASAKVKDGWTAWKCTAEFQTDSGPQTETMTLQVSGDTNPQAECLDCTKAWFVDAMDRPIGKDDKGVVFEVKAKGASHE